MGLLGYNRILVNQNNGLSSINLMINSYVPGVWGVFFSIILNLTSSFAFATNSDAGKELRWADQIVDGLIDGEEVWLSDGNSHEFLGIFTEGDTNIGTAAIIAHGIGVHPNWTDVIYPLRVGLAENGVATLSIQMPILGNDADPVEYVRLFEEVPGRVNAAISFLKDAGYKNITIVAHSMGSTMIADYLAGGNAMGIESFVAIGMGAGIENTRVNNITALSKIKIPILDLYGSDDLDSVLNSAESRAVAAHTGDNASFTRVVTEGANHFYQGYEQALVEQVLTWLVD